MERDMTFCFIDIETTDGACRMTTKPAAILPGLIALLWRRPDVRPVGVAAYVDEAVRWAA